MPVVISLSKELINLSSVSPFIIFKVVSESNSPAVENSKSISYSIFGSKVYSVLGVKVKILPVSVPLNPNCCTLPACEATFKAVIAALSSLPKSASACEAILILPLIVSVASGVPCEACLAHSLAECSPPNISTWSSLPSAHICEWSLYASAIASLAKVLASEVAAAVAEASAALAKLFTKVVFSVAFVLKSLVLFIAFVSKASVFSIAFVSKAPVFSVTCVLKVLVFSATFASKPSTDCLASSAYFLAP